MFKNRLARGFWQKNLSLAYFVFILSIKKEKKVALLKTTGTLVTKSCPTRNSVLLARMIQVESMIQAYIYNSSGRAYVSSGEERL